jgi:hypothetical protein
MENPQKPIAVAVVGSRTLANCPALLARLDELHAAGLVAEVVSGGAAGVDTLAARWAMRNLVKLTELRPDYRAHGSSATHLRNAEIVKRAQLVLLAWDGASPGTLSSARAAARLGRRCEWLAAPGPAPRPAQLRLL